MLERVDREDHVREKILFATTSHFRVPAYVLIPKPLKAPAPAIVDLHSGRLVRLFPEHRVRSPYSYHLLRPPEVDARPAVRAFCEWIKEQVQVDRETAAG